ncbi:MAG: 3-phosphoshikimate 1-carboxyvinyltransferase [Crocinitomicaceae bacterium]|nr:3-phosphoshikimate 1-carboxyvinyltransferase [Crocinitomicaceae bacterium]
MKRIIHPAHYHGTLQAPASKSYLQRAIALACLAEGVSIIQGYTPSKDVDAAIRIIREMGARVLIEANQLTIEGVGLPTKKMVLNCGESGLSTRMFSPIAAISNQEVVITGEGSLLNRPMLMIEDALTKLGKHVQTTNGKLPITFKGDLKSGKIIVDGSESSQLITGLLIALPLLKTDSELHVMNPTSIPYIQMTLDILADFGIHVSHENYSIYRMAARQKVKPANYRAEGDWSGTSFHLVAAAITGEVTLLNLNLKSSQADREIITALESCGAKLEEVENGISVCKNQLNAFQFDATHCPDLFPPLAALAACCKGVSEVKGVFRLKNKESDRGISIQSEFKKLGIDVEITNDVMLIHGGKVTGGIVHSHNDHRMAMALAVLGLVSENVVEIDGAEAVAKSYPAFFEDFELLTN